MTQYSSTNVPLEPFQRSATREQVLHDGCRPACHGSWFMVELGDGQVAGLPETAGMPAFNTRLLLLISYKPHHAPRRYFLFSAVCGITREWPAMAKREPPLGQTARHQVEPRGSARSDEPRRPYDSLGGACVPAKTRLAETCCTRLPSSASDSDGWRPAPRPTWVPREHRTPGLRLAKLVFAPAANLQPDFCQSNQPVAET
jgi:hypothetical protein